METLLQAQQLSKSFDQTPALRAISFDIPKGSICGLLGPNGSGKTTLLRLITRLYLPDEGEILFNNTALQEAHRRHMGYLPEERGLYKKLRVGEQLIYFGRLHGLSFSQAKSQAKYWCDRLNALDWWNKRPGALSKGMAQKIQLIAALLHKPTLLILDEPSSGFDVLNQAQIIEQLRYLQAQGTTLLISTHRMDLVENVCDYIICLNRSHKVLEGTPQSLQTQQKPTYVLRHTNARPAFPPGCYLLDQQVIDSPAAPGFEKPGFESHIQLNGLTFSQLLAQVATHSNITYAQVRVPSIQDLFLQAIQRPISS